MSDFLEEDQTRATGHSHVLAADKRSNLTSTGDYEIHVEGGAQSTDIILVAITDRVSVIGAYPNGSVYAIYARGNNSGDPLDTPFSFVIYRP